MSIEKVKLLLETHGAKHLGIFIKKDAELYALVNACYGDTLSEKAYNYMYSPVTTCPNGKPYNFTSITHGYRMCGKAATCECVKNSVSKNVSITKKSMTDEEKKATNAKRDATNLEKYGVSNIGQIDKAKAAHAEFYADQSNIDEATRKSKQTRLERYGDENYNNIEQAKITFSERYTSAYWAERYENPNIEVLYDKEFMADMYGRMNVYDMADELNVHVQTIYRYLNIHEIRVPYTSSEEDDVYRHVKSLGIDNIIRNTRLILPSGKELDIYLPDLNIAIEYNGIYWHHDGFSHITKTYHFDKFKESESIGITLITIFSSDWKNNNDIVKEMLRNKLGKNPNKLYARKCTVAEISSQETVDFLKQHHVQGYATSTYRYGLFYEGELVNVMTFSKSRMGMGKKDDGYELVRFAVSTRVVGGASKLLNHFIKTVKPNKIVSFSDNEWGSGNLYNQLGFELAAELKPSYKYIKPREEKMYHRLGFTKHKLVEMGYDASMTEREITEMMGFMRIWDCGKRKWVMDNIQKS